MKKEKNGCWSWRRLASLLALTLLIALPIGRLVDFVLVDDVHSYTRIMLEELYNCPENIDTLFLGPSHCYKSVDPAIFTEVTGEKAFNAGTSQQLTDGAWFLLREAAKSHRLKTVYLEVFYPTNHQQASSDIPEATYIITDYARSSPERWQYLWEMGGAAALLDDLVHARHNVTSPGEIKETWRAKLTDGYQPGSYRYVTYGNEEYRGDGFVYGRDIISPDTDFTPIAPVDEAQPVSAFALEYIRRMAAFCRENGIELVLFSAPLPDAYTSRLGNYQAYVDAMKALGEELGFDYWDFCLVREPIGLGYDTFSDAHHLNGPGAEKFSACFAKIAKEVSRGRDAGEFFYDTYEEKLQKAPDGTIS